MTDSKSAASKRLGFQHHDVQPGGSLLTLGGAGAEIDSVWSPGSCDRDVGPAILIEIADCDAVGRPLAIAKRHCREAATAAVAVADLNGDGLPDIIVANRYGKAGGSNYVCLNRGRGKFDSDVFSSTSVRSKCGKRAIPQAASRGARASSPACARGQHVKAMSHTSGGLLVHVVRVGCPHDGVALWPVFLSTGIDRFAVANLDNCRASSGGPGYESPDLVAT